MKFSIPALLLAICVGLIPTKGHSESPRVELIVPAYFYPTRGEPHWPALIKAVSRVPITAILNPHNGPGRAIDPNYIIATRALHKAGGRIIGYVYTQYGQRPINHVVADMQRYLDWYPIDGFFIDEMSNNDDPALIAYYRHIFEFAKRTDPARTYRVIGNPGTSTAVNYLNAPVADALIISEGAKRAYQQYPVAPWVQKMAGMLFITDDSLPNPWDSLPGYWTQQVDCVAAINQGQPDC